MNDMTMREVISRYSREAGEAVMNRHSTLTLFDAVFPLMCARAAELGEEAPARDAALTLTSRWFSEACVAGAMAMEDE